MTETIKVTDLPDFDMAEHLKSDEDIANYLTLVLEENDASEFTHALGIIARARGMTEMARWVSNSLRNRFSTPELCSHAVNRVL